MIPIDSHHVETYLFRRLRGRVRILCLRRAAGIALPGVWQPVTGRRRRGERALVAAAREVREETGLEPVRWWGLETLSIWFESASDRFVALPIYAAEVAPDADVRLSREHDAFAWLAPRAAGARFAWETQRRALAALEREVLRGRSAHLLECTALLAELRSGRPRPRAPVDTVRRARAGPSR